MEQLRHDFDFLGRNRLEAPALEEVIEEARCFMAEPLRLKNLMEHPVMNRLEA